MSIAFHSEGSTATTSSLTSLSLLLHRLHRPEQNEAGPPIAHDPSEKLLSLLTSSTYRKGSFRQIEFGECRPTLLATLMRCVRVGKPIQLTLMAFPFKVPNPAKVGLRRIPDLAEFAAILRLCRLNSMVKAIYEPGLEVQIIHDGSYLADTFGITLDEVHEYEAYFRVLVRTAGADDFICCHDFLSLIGGYASKVKRELEDLRMATLEWWQANRNTAEWADLFSKTLGMMNLRELPAHVAAGLMAEARQGRLPARYEELERQVCGAMLQYHLRDVILHRFDPRPEYFPDAIHATTQVRPGRLALWLIERGRSLLPWHGIGVIDIRGQARVTSAERVANNVGYHPVFMDGEQTPFFYVETTLE
jgi:Pyoverdine/dityrosine biosynthesis protein